MYGLPPLGKTIIRVASIEVTTQFKHQVGLDLMFYKKHVILHMIDRCTRWYAAVIILSKDSAAIIAAIHDTWVSIHGAMQELIVDGEKAIESWQADKYFENHIIKVIRRAPGQHARFIERRGALTRDALHKVESQLAEEGVAVKSTFTL